MVGASVAATGVAGVPAVALAQQTPPTKWDREVDVVVVGAGVGLAAAIQAKMDGADVLVVEKGDHIGGLWISAGGSCTMGGTNVVQQAAGVVDDNEAWYQDEMYSNEYRGVPEIMRTLVDLFIPRIAALCWRRSGLSAYEALSVRFPAI